MRFIEPDNTTLSFYELTEKYPDEPAAIAYFTAQRWPDGPFCPDCGDTDVYNDKRKQHLPRYKCRGCQHQFTVTSGTVMDNTKLPLRKWLWAFHMLGGAKKSIPSRHLARQLGITLKSAWHLGHRIRSAMTKNDYKLTDIVETDTTLGGGRTKHKGRGYRGNRPVIATAVTRSSHSKRGEARTRPKGQRGSKRYIGQANTTMLQSEMAEKEDGRTLGPKIKAITDPENTVLMTDDATAYKAIGKHFKEHHAVNHSREEYVRQEEDGHLAHTNTAEGLFGNLKRQLGGTHHSTSKRHLQRYLEEYDHKYNNRDLSDVEVTEEAIGNVEGRKVTLFKSEGGGDALFERKATDPPKKESRRGWHAKKYGRKGMGKKGVRFDPGIGGGGV